MPDLSLNDWVGYGLLIILLIVFIIAYLVARVRSTRQKRLPEEDTPLNVILHHSSERGEGIVLSLGDGDSSQIGSLAGLAGLQSQAHVFRNSLICDLPPKALSGDGTLAMLSQQLNAGIYDGAVMPELFRMESSGLAGIGTYASLAGLLPELGRPDLNALVLQGELSPELILALDLAQSQGLNTLVASSSLSAQAASFLADENAKLGSEVFVCETDLFARQTGVRASLIALRILLGLLVIGLLGAVLLYSLGVLL